ncbi:MAG: hypothetical protein DIU83_11660 [Bacillota bacterium]|nr:MAG: hypothetical protein DIU83_11660 [Bacillota bacterium]
MLVEAGVTPRPAPPVPPASPASPAPRRPPASPARRWALVRICTLQVCLTMMKGTEIVNIKSFGSTGSAATTSGHLSPLNGHVPSRGKPSPMRSLLKPHGSAVAREKQRASSCEALFVGCRHTGVRTKAVACSEAAPSRSKAALAATRCASS